MTGDRAAWSAWSHRLMGDVTAIDSQVVLLLALADARTLDSAERLFGVYARMSLSARADLVRGLPDPPGSEGAFELVASWVKRLTALRNRLAHTTIVDVDWECAHLRSFYRGRWRQDVLRRAGMSYAHKMARETADALDWLTPQCADLEVWGQVMGFDDGQPGNPSSSQ